MPIETYTHTVQDVVTEITRKFGDEAGVQIDVPDILRWINDGQREIIQNSTTINETVASTAIVANQDAYPIASDPGFSLMQNIHTVMYNGGRIENMSFNDAMDYIAKSSAPPVGDPQVWYVRAGVLTLWPIPKMNIAGGLKIYFTKAAPRVTGTGDPLGIPDNYYNALLKYVAQQAYEMDENFQAAGIMNQQFDKAVNSQANQTTVQQREFLVIPGDPDDFF
jgi:hypothetical protein